MIYSTSLARGYGPAIFIEAQGITLRWILPLSQRPEDEQELERLRDDGHRVTRERKGWRIDSSSDSIRATQLYRTLLHEIGHHVDRLQHSSLTLPESDDRFFARPHLEREAAAHRYADEWASRLRRSDVIPFKPIIDAAKLRRSGLVPEWFAPRDTSVAAT